MTRDFSVTAPAQELTLGTLEKRSGVVESLVNQQQTVVNKMDAQMTVLKKDNEGKLEKESQYDVNHCTNPYITVY